MPGRMTVKLLFESGLSHHQAGRLAEAERIYRQILAQKPDHVDALHLLGVVVGQSGRFDAAVELMQRAIRLKPDCAEAHGDLGEILTKFGHLDDAIDSYRQAIRLKPDLALAHCRLGSALRGLGRLDEAIAACRQAIRLNPGFGEAHGDLADALKEKGQLDEAIASYREAIRLRPDLAGAHNNLGVVLERKGLPAEAIAVYRQAIRLKPEYAEVYNNMGSALTEIGQFDEAIAACRQVIRLKPDYAKAHYNLGIALQRKGQLDEAIAAYRQAICINPDDAEAYNNLGTVLHMVGQFDEAIAACGQAIRLRPDYGEAHYNLGIALERRWQLDEAIAAYRQAIRFKPDFVEAHSNLLFKLNYSTTFDAEAILAEHRAWSDRHARPLMSDDNSHANECLPDRRLRIGYVSPDFRSHSISYFLIPLLEHHDRRMLELFCYANVQRPDDVTERIKRSCDIWRSIVGLGDDAIARLIRSDGIDILVDLSGHTAFNSLRVFARKPAPIQVTYLGYPNTTGIAAIDYRLTDALADPPGMTDDLNVEKLWRLPMCAWCYDPLLEAPEIQSRGNGPTTFGCFNAITKINREMVAIWAELLKQVPGSRLLLKSAGAGEASSRQRLSSQFIEHGVSIDRIEMHGWIADSRGHLELYGQIDVALDTYPYHGTTTTCEALWMGVPVVTLAGRTHVSRVGVSLLTHAGLLELVAPTPDEYLTIASQLASNRSRLEALRAGLRDQLKSSPLLDGTRFAAGVDAAYRQMWRNWCVKPQGD